MPNIFWTPVNLSVHHNYQNLQNPPMTVKKISEIFCCWLDGWIDGFTLWSIAYTSLFRDLADRLICPIRFHRDWRLSKKIYEKNADSKTLYELLLSCIYGIFILWFYKIDNMRNCTQVLIEWGKIVVSKASLLFWLNYDASFFNCWQATSLQDRAEPVKYLLEDQLRQSCVFCLRWHRRCYITSATRISIKLQPNN